MNNKSDITSENIEDVFDEHIKFELVDKDVDATMKTMVKEPYVHLVPVHVVRVHAAFFLQRKLVIHQKAFIEHVIFQALAKNKIAPKQS